MADWRANLVESPDGIAAILAETKRIAVPGIKTEAQSGQMQLGITNDEVALASRARASR
jgi:hypothetical protein